MDRRKGGLKRSIATEGAGIPLGIVSAGANRHDSPLLGPTLQAATAQVGPYWPEQVTVHLDAGYDSKVTGGLLEELGMRGEIARKGVAAPIQVGKRWVCERNPFVDERLRKATPLHRPRRQDRRLLPLPRRRVRHRPCTHPRSPNPLPLGHPTHHPTPQINQMTVS